MTRFTAINIRACGIAHLIAVPKIESLMRFLKNCLADPLGTADLTLRVIGLRTYRYTLVIARSSLNCNAYYNASGNSFFQQQILYFNTFFTYQCVSQLQTHYRPQVENHDLVYDPIKFIFN